MISFAITSDDRKYRYFLERIFKEDVQNRILFIMLNPSTGDGTKDDPTIRRCIGFAKREKFDSLIITNIYTYRTPNPKDLKTVADPFGPDWSFYFREALRFADKIVVAWGGSYPIPAEHLAEVQFELRGYDLYCLGTTKKGHPRHPLYLPQDTPFIRFPDL